MTLTGKENEALARLVGWITESSGLPAKLNPAGVWWKRVRHGRVTAHTACPDMATSEGADELVEFCRVRRLYVYVHPGCNGYEAEVLCDDNKFAGQLKYIANTQAIQETRCEAVAHAVYAARGYLTEKEPTDGKET